MEIFFASIFYEFSCISFSVGGKEIVYYAKKNLTPSP